MKTVNGRKTDYDIEDIFLQRWSPRAMSGETITPNELMILFEAARWAPSSMNNQPWRFIYCMRDGKSWGTFFSFLSTSNQLWCKMASALILVLSKNTFDHNGSISPTHAFDTGSAWENLALQATRMGLVTHGIGGISREIARQTLHIPDEYDVVMMIAVGRPGKKENLPKALQEREKPSQRRTLSEIVFEESFG